MVGETGFEPATCCSQSSRASQAALFPDVVQCDGDGEAFGRIVFVVTAHSVRNLPLGRKAGRGFNPFLAHKTAAPPPTAGKARPPARIALEFLGQGAARCQGRSPG